MRWAVIVFPGSNCDRDVHHVLTQVLGQEADLVSYRRQDLSKYEALVLPGGFSYGDYLRAGALASVTPVMASVAEAAAAGKLVLGICNGFQVLCETGLLPGALQANTSLRFRCLPAHLRVENNRTAFTNQYRQGEVLEMPIAHGEGNYFLPDGQLDDLEAADQIAFRYCNARGELEPQANPNGSTSHIAGVTNRAGNVLGLMPHPERCAEELLGGLDGRRLFSSMITSWQEKQQEVRV